MRQYSRDRLADAGEGTMVRERHLAFFREESERRLVGEGWRAQRDRLEREHDNLRAALEWCSSGGVEAGMRIGAALWGFWAERGYATEGREHLARLLALAGTEVPTPARAKALNCAGRLARNQGDYGPARALYEESLAIFQELGDAEGTANALLDLGHLAHLQGQYEAARTLIEQSLAIFRELGDKVKIAYSLQPLGQVAYALGDFEAARALATESLAIFRELRNLPGIGGQLYMLGHLARRQEDYEAAWALFEEGLACFREMGDHTHRPFELWVQADKSRQQGEHGAARALFMESLALRREQGDKRGIVGDLEELAAVAVAQAEPERGARLFGAAEGLRAAMGVPPRPVDRHVTAARTALGEEAFAAAWAEGRAMALEDAIEYALENADV